MNLFQFSVNHLLREKKRERFRCKPESTLNVSIQHDFMIKASPTVVLKFQFHTCWVKASIMCTRWCHKIVTSPLSSGEHVSPITLYVWLPLSEQRFHHTTVLSIEFPKIQNCFVAQTASILSVTVNQRSKLAQQHAAWYSNAHHHDHKCWVMLHIAQQLSQVHSIQYLII